MSIGVYYKVCSENNINPKTFRDAKLLGGNAFDAVCKQLLEYDIKQNCEFI